MPGSPQIFLRTAVVVLAFGVFWSPVPAAGVDYQITEIRFTGNEKTRANTLLRELNFTAGMTVSAAEIEKGRKSILALGLFTVVETRLHPTKTGHRLSIRVREKHFFLPVPIVHVSGDGDWTYGVVSRTDNLLGLNQQLKVMFRQKVYRDTDIEREDRLQFRYEIPRIANTTFGLELGLHREKSLLNEARQNKAGRYKRRLTEGRITASRWLRVTGPSRGWRISVGLKQQAYKHMLLSGDGGLFFDADVFTIFTRLEKQEVATLVGRRTGQHYGYEIQTITQGAKRTINQHFGFYRSYREIGFYNKVQLHTHLRIGACSGSVFGNPCFSLGGDTTIRGFRRDTLRGNVFVLTTLQLLAPLMSAQNVRGVIFLDAGRAADSMSSATIHQSALGIGAGLVWNLKRFVRTDIRVEIAHGLGVEGGNRAYAASSMLF
jgi:outer membrane protein assembly factor BamA